MNEKAILFELNPPLRTFVNDLYTRVTACESRQGDSSENLALRAKIDDLRKDIDFLKSTDFSLLFNN